MKGIDTMVNNKLFQSVLLMIVFLVNPSLIFAGASVDSPANVEIILNDLNMVFDSQTGCILSMSYPDEDMKSGHP